MPDRHTGEGIFFTSKAADALVLRSHGIELLFDSRKRDIFVSRKRKIRGTEVRFFLSRNTRRRLEEVFAEYAPENFEYRFQRTRVLVKLFRDAYVSRSEAKRLLVGLEKFKEVVLDFRGVRSLGQGFADEVFRVFAARHPEIEIKTENLDPALSTLILHVLDEPK
ncbi:MAG: STAS-like domain-containing protein [Acidobacteriota bacterium]